MTRISLNKPVRVFLRYATENGETLFFDDIYEHDKRLDVLLRTRYTPPKLNPSS